MTKSLPYSVKDIHYDNAKFRHRSSLRIQILRISDNLQIDVLDLPPAFDVITQTLFTSDMRRECVSCSTGKLLGLLMIVGLACLMLTHANKVSSVSDGLAKGIGTDEEQKFQYIYGKANEPDEEKWKARQQHVKEAFIHAWSGYKKFAMGSDELMPLSQEGIDGLGGLGATIVDALDSAMIMGLEEVVSEAGSWVESHLLERISQKGQVNLLKPQYGSWVVYECLSFDPTPIPFSDVVLSDSSALPSPGDKSSTSEVSTLQLEFNYLSEISGDPNPQSGQFIGEEIRLGSRGDSYYEYLIKVWLQLRSIQDGNFTYLYDMHEEAMRGVRHLLVQKTIPNELVFVGELPSGPSGTLHPKMDHLVCFLPGTLALGATKGITKGKAMKDNLLTFEDLENLKLAEDLAKTCFEMYSVTATGLAPEIAYFHTKDYFESGLDGGNKSSEYVNDIVIKRADRHNLLRPETVESLFVLYRITQDWKYREWGWQIFESFEKYTKVDSGGYTSLDDVTVLPPRRRDKMETFFLAETLKYLYLLFGDHSLMPLDKFIFNTEAHPLPLGGAAIYLERNSTMKGSMLPDPPNQPDFNIYIFLQTSRLCGWDLPPKRGVKYSFNDFCKCVAFQTFPLQFDVITERETVKANAGDQRKYVEEEEEEERYGVNESPHFGSNWGKKKGERA
ncbi:Mannosyl-oligosaccharide 1,2-alpha-mannosidase MNS3 [Hibiscus syriacus]|uniref:alpha-1,2-Mannosidase n=1 Tax=Hibiscus syriacus TaxID=106335 RepID=A0A6A2XGV5_HIBSY|nr:Mannosyl-oligosaccharide 1,2-alpha-mannosidase MNS3 [Hibiscus syriacus]